MSAALSNVVPLRWTSRGFTRAGVVFTITGANVAVAGPSGRTDLHQALVAEITRRVEAFSQLAPLNPRHAFPRVRLPGVVVPPRASACDSCGDALDAGRGGMCPLCIIALQKTLRQLGRIA